MYVSIESATANVTDTLHLNGWLELSQAPALNNKLIEMNGNYAAVKSIISLTVQHLPFKNTQNAE